MKAIKRILYSNFDLDALRNVAIDSILDIYSYNKEEDIPEELIEEEINVIDDTLWEDFTIELKKFLSNENWIIRGNIGVWYANSVGSFRFSNIDKLLRNICNDTYFKIFDTNGHLHIECRGHDGVSFLEIKKITDKGNDYIERHYLDDDAKINKVLWNNNTYTHIPNFAHKVYGMKIREYEKV